MQQDAKARTWPTTHWSLIGRAGSDGGEERLQAIKAIVELYMPVLRRHLRFKHRIAQQQVDDLVQEFVLSKILESRILELADRERGNFRSFLGTALDNFMANWWRNRAAIKRGMNRTVTLTPELVDREVEEDPGQAFDYAWARQVLGQAMRMMKRECFKKARSDVWKIFKRRVLIPSLKGERPIKFSVLAAEAGVISKTRTKSLLVTANRMFVRNLRNVLNLYQRDEEEIDQEIRHLWRAVAKPRANFRR